MSENVPAHVVPGERIRVELTFEVVETGTIAYRRPGVQFVSSQSDAEGKRVAFRVTPSPWQWPEKQAAGDVLSAVAEVDIPIDFPVGPATFTAHVARHHQNRWEYARLLDVSNKPLGARFQRPVQVAEAAPVTGETTEAGRSIREVDIPLEIPRMTAPPLTGPFDPAAWRQAAEIPRLVEYNGEKELAAATTAWIGHDGQSLYIAVVCQEPAMDQARQAIYTDHDSPIWNNESIQFFFAAGDRQSYTHFIVDLLNQRYDALGMDTYGYNPPWRSDVQREGDRWIVRAAWPFTSLAESAPQAGQAWYANIARERWAEREISAWKPTFGGLHAPGRYGTWVFDSLAAYLEHRLQALAATDRGAWESLVAEDLAGWDTRHGQALAAVKAASAEIAAHYARLEDQVAELERSFRLLMAQAMRQSGRGIALTQAHPYERFMGQPSPLDRPAGPQAITVLRQEWVDLAWNIENVSDQPLTLRFSLRPGSAEGAKGASWNHQPFLRFGLENITTLWQQAVPVAGGDGVAIHDGLVPRPDGVIQVPPGGLVQVWLSVRPSLEAAAGVHDAHVLVQPVDGTSLDPVTLPLAVTVLPRDLRSVRGIHVFTWNVLPPDVTGHADWFDAHIQDLVDHGVDVFMLHNLRYFPRPRADRQGNLIGELSFDRIDRVLDHALGRFNYYYLTLDIWEKRTLRRDLFNLDIDDPAYEKAFKTWYGAMLRHLLGRGITHDQLLVNPYDENIGPRSLQLATWMKEVDPRVKLIQNSSPPVSEPLDQQKQGFHAIDRVTDYWMPHYNYFFPENLAWFHEAIRQSGKPRWMYYYSLGPNEKNQAPGRHYLSKFWWAFQQDVGAVGWWAMQYYGDPWYRAGWRNAYDTSLVYPVDGGVIPSRRWQAWRQGWQDHTLLTLTRGMLEEAGDQAGLEKLEAHVAQVVARPGDPVVAAQARQWLKEQIAKIVFRGSVE